MDFVTSLILAFAGGMFGATIGGLNSFVLTGLAAFGAAIAASTGNGGGFAGVPWGFLLGPHIAFQGGASAVAFAQAQGKVDAGAGRDIGLALVELNDPMILAVGGVFGALGYIVNYVLAMVPPINGMGWTDTVALTILINASLTRILFGVKTKSPFGQVREGDVRWHLSDVAAWLPWQHKPAQLIALSVAIALPFSALIAENPDLMLTGFGITAFWLIWLRLGVNFPVGHHIAHPAQIATLATGNVWWGLVFGLLGAFLGEIYACIFLNHADTHIDPPAVAILTMTTLAALLAPTMNALGGIVPLVIAVVVAVLIYVAGGAMQKGEA